MNGFEPTLFDKLFDSDSAQSRLRWLSIDELKSAVARDLESLLNTRMSLKQALLSQYPEAERSLVAYGLADFSSLSLRSIHDRDRICGAIRTAIATGEPRLRMVEVRLAPEPHDERQLRFSIKAWLTVRSASEPVGFDATLQPGTLRYSVTSTGAACGMR